MKQFWNAVPSALAPMVSGFFPVFPGPRLPRDLGEHAIQCRAMLGVPVSVSGSTQLGMLGYVIIRKSVTVVGSPPSSSERRRAVAVRNYVAFSKWEYGQIGRRIFGTEANSDVTSSWRSCLRVSCSLIRSYGGRV
jgi:hypothetical protein